ncbi:cytochrome oxidase small assembly protein [Chitinilyticum litopenaei]|nr:cytochrome oxidase small assembly protein [Chitinilyticum litopenaei]
MNRNLRTALWLGLVALLFFCAIILRQMLTGAG